MKRENLTMIETLFKESMKVGEAVEIKLGPLTLLAGKTNNGYEIEVTDKDGKVLDQQVYKMN
jgi:hypothetical protein